MNKRTIHSIGITRSVNAIALLMVFTNLLVVVPCLNAMNCSTQLTELSEQVENEFNLNEQLLRTNDHVVSNNQHGLLRNVIIASTYPKEVFTPPPEYLNI